MMITRAGCSRFRFTEFGNHAQYYNAKEVELDRITGDKFLASKTAFKNR